MLQEKSLVVSLKVCKWTATKHDRKITDEVNTQHNAANDAGRYNKRLVAKKDLEAIQKLESEARSTHYELTLPWGENSERLLPAANYQEYIAKIATLKDKFDSAVAAFIANYPSVIADAKQRLNGMFKDGDYPSELEIGNKFSFKTTFMPVPDSDFRVQLTDGEVNKLREQVKTEVHNRMTEAVKDTWQRIKEQLAHMKDRLSNPEAKFQNSLFTNLKSLVKLLPNLNVTNDENITAICTQMTGLMVDPELVRNDTKLRSEKAADVTTILNKFDAFFTN